MDRYEKKFNIENIKIKLKRRNSTKPRSYRRGISEFTGIEENREDLTGNGYDNVVDIARMYRKI